MGLFRSSASKKRPEGGRILHTYKAGARQNDVEFFVDKVRAYYLERPHENARSWDFLLHKGSSQFFVQDSGPCYRLHRNQADACMELYKDDVLSILLRWRGKGDIGGLAAAPREHFFDFKSKQYEWSESQHIVGTDLICKDLSSQEVVAYFRSVFTPADKIGKFILAPQVEEQLEEALVATFLAYREWSIRRQMCLYGDDWFNQSVTI